MNAVCALDLMRVLAVEDELEDGGHIKDELESRLEAEVVPVTQLAEARRLLDSNDFDLIPLDCISCLEWLQELALDRGLPPVVVITRQGAEAAAAHALQSGASGFVVKAPGWGDQLAQVAEAVVADSLLQKATDVLDERSASVAAAVDESDELFFVFDRDARLVRWNKALRSLMGYKDDEMVDLDLGHFFLPEDAQRLENEFPGLSSNVTSLSLRLVPKTGKPILCDVRIGAVRDFSQQLVGIFGSGRESEQESNIAALTGLIIAQADENGVVTYINDEALEFLGKQRDEVLGKTVVEFMHPDDVGISLDAWREAVLGKTTKVGVIRTRTPLGWRYVEWNGVPRFDGTGHFIGFQVTGRDVTERQRSEELLKQMNAELEAFAHTVSHDLRGPLATMMMAADTLHQLIKDSADDEADMTISELAQMISDGTATAGALIEDLLRLAESGLAPREVEPVDIGEVVDQVAGPRVPGLEQDPDVPGLLEPYLQRVPARRRGAARGAGLNRQELAGGTSVSAQGQRRRDPGGRDKRDLRAVLQVRERRDRHRALHRAQDREDLWRQHQGVQRQRRRVRVLTERLPPLKTGGGENEGVRHPFFSLTCQRSPSYHVSAF